MLVYDHKYDYYLRQEQVTMQSWDVAKGLFCHQAFSRYSAAHRCVCLNKQTTTSTFRQDGGRLLAGHGGRHFHFGLQSGEP